MTQFGPTSTSTTSAPGAMTFVQITQRFEELLAQSQLPGLLPYSAMPAQEAGWLLETDLPAVISEVKGYEFANGDLTLLLKVEASANGTDAGGAGANDLQALAVARYQESGKKVWTYLNGDFGYVIVSKDHWSELGLLAQQAREGAPIDPVR